MNKHTPLSKKGGWIQTDKRRDNKSGVTGVCRHKGHNRWEANLQYKHQPSYIGSYKTHYEAARARLLKELELFGPDKAPQRKLFPLYNITIGE